jgi:hypothetical protein
VRVGGVAVVAASWWRCSMRSTFHKGDFR